MDDRRFADVGDRILAELSDIGIEFLGRKSEFHIVAEKTLRDVVEREYDAFVKRVLYLTHDATVVQFPGQFLERQDARGQEAQDDGRSKRIRSA